jgi:hypothetical protein
MGKKSSDEDPVEKAQVRLAKAQLRFQVAEEKHAQARERGKQEIEKARLKQAKWLARATQRLERRAEAVARAEGRLLSLTAGHEPDSAPAEASSPEAVADLLREREAEAPREDPAILPGSPDSSQW